MFACLGDRLIVHQIFVLMFDYMLGKINNHPKAKQPLNMIFWGGGKQKKKETWKNSISICMTS